VRFADNYLQTMLKYIVETTKADVVFIIGVNLTHNVWNNSDDEVTKYTLAITQALKDAS